MTRMQTIEKYFPLLSPLQKERFGALDALYRDWNAKINVISRKDMDNFYLHHVLHSLAIAKAVQFNAGERVLDIGTGGGFPGIPLAIMFPETRFTLCDSIGKKIKVASAVAQSLSLDNVECVNCRVEDLKKKYDFIVSRAVTDLSQFYSWIRESYNAAVFYLKGGDITSETALCASKNRISVDRICSFDISSWFEEEYFNEKKVVIITK